MSKRLAPIGLLILTVGCSTHSHRLTDIRKSYYRGDIEGAHVSIDKAMRRKSSEADVLKLDRAMVLLCEGKPGKAEKLMREVRDNFEHLEKKDIGEMALSAVTDDQALSYAGEDYEKVLVRVFLALANLMDDGRDAHAYALQVADKQRQIIEKGAQGDGKNPKESYKQVAIGPYLYAAIREESHNGYDEAARALQQVCHWAPEFSAAKHDLQRVTTGRHSQKGNGVVYVITLVGRGPYKVERAEIATQLALLVADRIVSSTGKHTLPPTIAPVKVPRVVVPKNFVNNVHVLVDGKSHGMTETITDIGRMAKEQCDAMLPYVIGRAVARRVIKKAMIYGVKEAVQVERHSILDIVMSIAGIAWEATENADTRCWGLLPEKIQVRRIELPAGTHQLALQSVDARHQAMGPVYQTTVQVADGRNTYVLAGFPDSHLVGRIIASGSGR